MLASPRGRRFARVMALLAMMGTVLGFGHLNGGRADSAVLVAGSSHVHAPADRSGPFVVVVVIDAARADEIDPSRMPNLERLIIGGTEYTQAWVGQLPSITETSHATIGTGVLPNRHLILGDTWRLPGKNQMQPSLLSAQLDRTGFIGKLMRQARVPSLAALVHQRYPGSIVVTLSGHKIYAADAMGAGVADYVGFGTLNSRGHYVPSAIPGHMPARGILNSSQLDLRGYPRQPGSEDRWTTTLAEKFLFKYHPRLLMINLPEVDIYGHLAGTQATVMQPLMSNVDQQIGRLIAAYGRAGLLPNTYFVVTADHAMIPSDHTVMSTRIDKVIAAAGGKPLYVGHGDYSPIWLQNVSTVPKVAVALASASIPNIAAVYAKSPRGAYTLVSSPGRLADPAVNAAYSDLLATFNAPGSPDIVLLYDENTITMTPLFQKIGRKGDHGGATWGAQHIPLVIEGPGVKQDYQSPYPARLVDIAPTVETLLGIRPSRQDGIPLADSMLNPPSWAVSVQEELSPRLASDVAALEQEAADRPNLGR